MAVMEVGVEDRENSLVGRENVPSVPWEDSTASVEVGRTLPASKTKEGFLPAAPGRK